MTNEEINIAIAEACGAQPELVGWWAYKGTPDGGSICYSAQSKEEIEKWLASLPEGSWAKDYVPKAFYRYPNYCGDLNAMHEALELISQQCKDSDFWFFLREIIGFPDAESDWDEYYYFQAINATAHQRAEAFLRTIGKWEE